MAKFCGKCGARLDEKTGLCPTCNAEKIIQQVDKPAESLKEVEKKPETSQQQDVPLSRKEARKKRKADKKAAKEDRKTQKKAAKKVKKKEKWGAKSFGQKVRSVFLRIIAWLLLLAVLAVGFVGVLGYYNIVKIPIFHGISNPSKPEEEQVPTLDTVYDDEDTSGSDEATPPVSNDVTPPDAESFFENNSNVISVIDAVDSDTVRSESEACNNFAILGFTGYPITSEYSMDGEYYKATSISDTSSAKHPIYQTYYVTASGDVWTVFDINGVIMANPVSYNVQSGLEAQIIISESNTVTSYDGTTNKFYETIPNESSLIVKTVSRIDAQTLEGLTFGAIDEL